MGRTIWLQLNSGDDLYPDGRHLAHFNRFSQSIWGGTKPDALLMAVDQLATQEGLDIEPLLCVTGVPVDLPPTSGDDEQESMLSDLSDRLTHNAWAEHCWQDLDDFRTVLEQWATALGGSTADVDEPDMTRLARAVMRDGVEVLLTLLGSAQEHGATQVRMMCTVW